MAKKKAPKKVSDVLKRMAGKPARKPLWDLDRDGVTQGLLSKFVVCRERTRLAYVEGWSGDGISVPLEFGKMFHACLEHYHTSRLVAPGAVIANYLKHAYPTALPEAKAELSHLSRVVAAMFPLYLEYWSGDQDHSFDVQEQPFRVTYDIPAIKRSVDLRGVWDGIFYAKGGRWLQENKTKGEIDLEGIQASLSQDLQTMLYCVAIRQAFRETPAGVLYNIVRRPGLRPRKQETSEEFAARVEADVRDRPEHYFHRFEHSLTSESLQLFEKRTLQPLLCQVVQWWESIKHSPFDPWSSPLHYQQPFGIYNPATNGQRGDFFYLLTKGVPIGIIQRTAPFPEIQELLDTGKTEHGCEKADPKAKTDSNG